jgi:hypothetical protein
MYAGGRLLHTRGGFNLFFVAGDEYVLTLAWS